jgi:hypothetical protein
MPIICIRPLMLLTQSKEMTEILKVEKIKRFDDMLVHTQKLKADYEERELLHESRGTCNYTEQFVTNMKKITSHTYYSAQ